MTMQAVQFEQYGAPEVLAVRSVPVPVPDPGQVLVRVRASGVNPHDTAVRSGRLRALTGRSFPKGVGVDFVGEVVQAGSRVAATAVGSRVWGVLPGIAQKGTGSAAEYVAVDTGRISAAPSALSATEAVSLLAGGTTAITALRDEVGLREGERILVRGATGGVGTVVVQYARALNAHVTTLSSARTTSLATKLGADTAYDYNVTSPAELGKFDVVFDAVGNDLRQFRKLIAPGGRMISVALGDWTSLTYVLTSAIFGPRRIRFFSGSPTTDLLTDLATLADSGALTPVVEETYAMKDVVAAHHALHAGGGNGGKRVLSIS
ncbi:NAD(P)-dependent alcohol dehydrogenase [Rhodococcus erythropolis]|uniref:NAD(P)-dependent alcohol dehydrogenase n=1 Tax=Rhodococcus erythropolis TaxID=1833 RepID=UPI0008C1FF45|nr:NAD(P)-dependent alcohol dehydrogenase [Rhodococcus erythropolis]OFV79259.1 quinone oxidoreductase 1 [Rhodococcus erythropolis]